MFRTGFAFCGTLLALILGAQTVKADSEVTYQITGTFSSTTTSSLLSGAFDTFTMSFTLPSQPAIFSSQLGDNFAVNGPFTNGAVQFSVSDSGGGSASGLMYLSFYETTSTSQPGGFFVDFCADGPLCTSGLEYQWEVPGPQLYTGSESSPTLFPTSFNFTSGQFVLLDCTCSNTIDASGTFDGSVSASVVTTPEPASAGLLALGVLALFAISFYQKRQSTLVRS